MTPDQYHKLKEMEATEGWGILVSEVQRMLDFVEGIDGISCKDKDDLYKSYWFNKGKADGLRDVIGFIKKSERLALHKHK